MTRFFPRRRGIARISLPSLALLAASGCATSAARPVSEPIPQPAAMAQRESPFLPIRYDRSTGRVLLTVPRLNEEVLYFSTLATGLGTPSASLDRSEVGTSAVVRFERHGARVYLVRLNTRVRAEGGDDALRRSVEESFPRSVLASFAVQSEGPSGVTVDATDFFLSDAFEVAGRLRAARMGTVRLDRERSYIDGEHTGAFPLNTEVRAVVTFTSDEPVGELRMLTPDPRTVAFAQHYSFVRPPDPPMAMRAFDPRAGLFATSYLDFAQPFDADYRQRAVMRWRLEPRDTAAYLRGELVEPVRPIVYYLDPAIPEPYRTAFSEGGMWWNTIFEAAGWRNAFRIEPLPPGVDPLDARYPAIQWVHRVQRGPSVGPSFSDPRTGEILSTNIRMDSYRSLVDHDIYMGLLPAAGDRPLPIDAEEFSMARRRQHTAHEIGHTLGLAHNFMAATQERASVMDYPYPLITLDEHGQLDISQAYRPSGGAHDTLAIRYAYTWYPNPEAEAEGLRRIVREAEARGLRFVTGGHASAAGSYPAATQWVEGADMLSALERTRAVRRLLIDRFDERAAQPGQPLAVLNRRFAHVYLHHRYALEGAVKYIGGMEFGYALRGEDTEPTRIIPAAEQRRALRMVLASLEPAELDIPDRIASLIPPVPHGYDSDLTLISGPAGPVLDPLATAHSLAQEIVDNLLHPQRAARVASFHARDATLPSLDEVLTALTTATWNAPATANRRHGALRRSTQRAALDGMLDLAGSRDATPEVRAITELHLQRLRERLVATPVLSSEERAHRAAARRDIELYLEGRDDRARRPRPEAIRLPWP